MKTSKTTFFKILFLLSSTLMLVKGVAQSNWTIEYPNSIRNGYFQITSPERSDLFYTFGYDQMRFNPSNQQFTYQADLPSTVFLKENLGSFSAPNRHNDVFFMSQDTGVMVHNEQILKTTDAGKSWTNVLTLNPNTQFGNSPYFTAVHFPTSKVGYAVGTADKIFKSVDEGSTWQELQWSDVTTPYRRLSQVRFLNDTTGYVLGYEVDDILLNIGVYTPIIYKTKDGGQTWDEQKLAETDHHYYKIYFTDTDTLYLSMVNRNYILPTDRILQSIDGGQNWGDLDLPGSNSNLTLAIRNVHWFSAKEGIVLGSKTFNGQVNQIYKTEDAGVSWREITISQGIPPIFAKVANLAMHFSGNYGLISGATGNLLFSDDKGDSWEPLEEGLPDIYDICTTDNIALAVGWGDLLLKKDRGGEWEQLQGPPFDDDREKALVKVAGRDDGTIAVIDFYSRLRLSRDNGNNWEVHFPTNDTVAVSIHFQNDQLKALARLSNGQLKWLTFEEENKIWSGQLIAENFPHITTSNTFVTDANRVFVIVNNTIFYSSDNGNQWLEFKNLPPNGFPRTFFVDREGSALVQTSDESIFFSNDQGNTWTEGFLSGLAEKNLNLEVSSLKGFGRLNENQHFALFHGTIDHTERYQTLLLLSNDNGQSWDLVDKSFNKEPLDLGLRGYAVMDGNLYMGESNGTILSYGIGKLPTSVRNPEISRLNVYPNPVVDQVTISGLDQFPAFYEVFAANGSLVGQGKLEQDNVTVQLPENLENGTYFLKVYTNSVFEVVKLVVGNRRN